ncbi:MAG: hypothetical protein Q8830_02975, partial [Candidatus Phytoplasma australasiaticum]|nr:hypothetical protein [Candidatus Phytoplasma australasiaticum]
LKYHEKFVKLFIFESESQNILRKFFANLRYKQSYNFSLRGQFSSKIHPAARKGEGALARLPGSECQSMLTKLRNQSDSLLVIF